MRALLVAFVLITAAPAGAVLFTPSDAEFADSVGRQLNDVATIQRLDDKSAAIAKRTATAWFFMYRCGGLPKDLPGVDARDVFTSVLGADVKNGFSATVLTMLGVLEVANAGAEKPGSSLCRFAREAAVLQLPR